MLVLDIKWIQAIRRTRVPALVKWVTPLVLIVIGLRLAITPWVQQWVNPPQQRKEVELFQTMIRGYDQDRLSWIVVAKTIWSMGNRTAFTLEHLVNGQVYDVSGHAVIQRMTAEKGEVNTRSKTFFLTQVSAELGYRSPGSETGLIAAKPEPRRVRIVADELRYYGNSKRTFLSGKVVIYQGAHRIVPNQGIEVDNAANIATIRNGFTAYVDQLIITGNSMTIYMDDEQSIVPDGVSGYRPASPTDDSNLDPRERGIRRLPTRFSAQKLMFSSKNGEDVITLEGTVVVTQPDKSMAADRLIYNRAQDVVTLENNVILKSNQLRWAMKNRDKPIKNDDIRRSVNEPVKIVGNKAVFEGGGRRGRVIGNVQIYQASQKTFAQKMEFDDQSGGITLLGSVSHEKSNADLLKCDELVIDITKEALFARRSITTEFKLRSKKE